MDDDRSTGSPEGVRISGAQEARRIVAQPPMWADDQGDDVSGDWMQAGDHTLSGVLGDPEAGDRSGEQGDFAEAGDGWGDDVEPAAGGPHDDPTPPAASRHGTGLASGDHPADEDARDDDAGDEDDDRFPDEMYDDPPPRRDPRSPSAPLTSDWGTAPGAADRVVAIGADDEPDDGWTSFAGGGPRWRREAADWADVDAADASGLADDESRVGTLDPNRSDQSDLYTFGEPRRAEEAPGRVSGPGSDARPGQGGEARPSGSQGSSGSRRSPDAATPATAGRRKARVAPPATLGVRVATGVTLAAVLGLILYVGKRPAAAVLVAAAVALAALELLTALRQRGFNPAIPAVLVGLVAMVAGTYRSGDVGVSTVAVLSVLTIMVWYLYGAERDRPVVNIAVSLLAFGYTAMAAGSAALLLRPTNGIGLLFAAIACTVGYDVVGFFVGSSMGKTKLAPEISPNKTVEGLVGGMIGSVLVGAVVFGQLSWHPWDTLAHGAVVGVVVAIAAPLGDLVESMMKRDLGMKDMGNVLPGHGGVLDRIDSMLFSVPAVFLLARVLGLA